MLSFALKNMAIKRVQVILIILSILISAGVAVLSYNTAEQVSDGITSNAGYYSVIVGPSGSKTQLAMNTMYFTEKPLGTIPYTLVDELKRDQRIDLERNPNAVIPFAMADSYNGYNVIGTTPAFLDGKSVASGKLFDEQGAFEVVLGATVAKVCNKSVGDVIYTSHSAGEEHKTPFTIVGILEETHTVYDRVVFTQLKTIWEVHEEEEEEEEHEDHDHEEMNGMVCAILVKTINPAYATMLCNDYDGSVYTAPDGDAFSLTALEPMDTMRDVLNDTNTTKYIVYALCAIILVMNIIIISIITLLNMYHSAKEISLMRLIGISMKRINLLYLIQNGIIGLVSTILAFGASRLCLLAIGDYVANMGVVLNVGKVYLLEWIILAAVFLISVLPTLICTFFMARRDSMAE